MGRAFQGSERVLHAWFCLFLFLSASSAIPMCTDLRVPLPSKSSLSFCSNKTYEEKGCCDMKAEADIQSAFQSMNVSESKCASMLKDILCAKCDQYSADLFLIQNPNQHFVPLLCNSTKTENNLTANDIGKSYCSPVWDACQNVSIFNSPFAPSLQGGSGGSATKKMFTKLIDLWQSQDDFCRAFCGSSNDGDACFSGIPFVPNVTNDEPPPQGVCLDKIGDGVYLNMVPHPDGSNRAFLATQTGQVYLVTLPDKDSSGHLELDESMPFLDLRDQLFSDANFRLMGLAFHPDFEKNGRFFASFNCDKTKGSACLGKCACNVDAGCDPSQLAGGASGVTPCQFHSVIAEYTVNGSSISPSEEVYEEVDLIRNGGNYGWRVYEGVYNYTPSWAPGGNTSASSIQTTFPIMGYDHKEVDPDMGSASITGGYVSRSQLDPCLYGRFLYADLYGAAMWAGVENPVGSGNFSSTKVSYNCSAKSPMPCTYAAESKTPTVKWILSFGEDNKKNVYMLAANGVYKVVHPSYCNYVCKKDVVSARPANGPKGNSSLSPPQSGFSSANAIQNNHIFWTCILLIILMDLN